MNPTWSVTAARRAFWTLGLVLALVSMALADARTPAWAAFDGPVAVDVRAVGDDQTTQLIVSFDRAITASHQLLDHPFRLVLDFERIGYGFEVDGEQLGGLVGKVRYGDMSENASRMIFEIGAPFEVVEIASGTRDQLYQLTIDVRRTSDEAFRQAVLDTMQTGSIVARNRKADRLGARPIDANQGAFTIVLDPGHGGIDSGAIGVGGTREKDVVLEFAHQMRKAMESLDGVNVLMTRDSDMFVRLDERVRFARQHNASLFVSLHADSVRQDYVRGATVYTISDKASDSISAEIARNENLSDAIAGVPRQQSGDTVNDILVDLARQETLGFSVQFARLAISHISQASRIINNPHRYAGFRVLRAPDVPSVLIELGYLSNAEDEKLLNDAAWRAKLADELTLAIAEFGALSGRKLAAGPAE